MPLNAPNLDSRTFADLMQEARNRIPRFTTEWTNFNVSDPGITLVELHAWMTETILYEMNRVPELNYVKFLDLLGIVPEPAHPARTELSFTLDKLDLTDDMLIVPVPRLTQLGVDDADIKENIVFETDRSLLALNAHVGLALAPVDEMNRSRALVASYDKGTNWLHSFDPFTATPKPDRCLYLALLLRPNLKDPLEKYLNDALPAAPLDLFVDAVEVYDKAPDDSTLMGPPTFACASAFAPKPDIEWQIWTGPDAEVTFDDAKDTGWTPLALSADGSDGLAASGHLVLEVPAKATALSPRQVDAPFWRSFGQTKLPVTYAEMKSIIMELDIVKALGEHWDAMGLDDPDDTSAIAACGSDATKVIAILDALPETKRPDPEKLSAADWPKIDLAFKAAFPMVADEFRPMYWIRAKLNAIPPVGARKIASLRGLRLNTVPATQGQTRLEDRIGLANGRPGQVVNLPKLPVLIDPQTQKPDLQITVGGEIDWIPVSDFFNSGPDSKHFLLDPGLGEITFGDGLRGRIPVAGVAFLVTRYRTGGGTLGNVGAGTISKIRGQLDSVKGATNLRAAHDGSNAETLDAVKLRAPHELRHRDRAVSAADFSDLARRTPGVALHRALALSRRAVQGGALVTRDGAVTLILLPRNDQAMPQPSEAQLQAVCRWLEPRRLITTELHLTGPTYAEITQLALRIQVADSADIPTVSEDIYKALLTFLHPITGGTDGHGWEFGAPIFHADIYERVLDVAGVNRASALALAVTGGTTDIVADVTTIPEAALPVLTRDKIKLVAGYV